MKSLVQFIQEKLIIKKRNNKYNYFPKTKAELKYSMHFYKFY